MNGFHAGNTFEKTVAASQRCAEVEGQRCPTPSRTWCDASRRWQERARAGDAPQPSPLPGEEEAHRSDARQERLGMISKIVKDLYVTLNLADLPNLEPDEARQFLPTLRKVKRQTGLGFHRLTDASTEDLDAYLRRERSCGQPVSLLHPPRWGGVCVSRAVGTIDLRACPSFWR